MPIKSVKRLVDRRDTKFNLLGGAVQTIQDVGVLELSNREIVDVATISDTNLTLNGLSTINGLAVEENTAVLVNGQTDKKENGIYTASTGDWERITNNLNDIKLVKVIGGDYNTWIYTLINEPVEVDVDNIEYIPISNNKGNIILSTEIAFDTTLLNLGTASYTSILSGVSGRSIDVISAFVTTTLTSANATDDAIITYQNGSDPLLLLEQADLTGTGTIRSKLILNNGVTRINSNAGDSIGFNHPTATFTGTINGTIHLTYRLI